MVLCGCHHQLTSCTSRPAATPVPPHPVARHPPRLTSRHPPHQQQHTLSHTQAVQRIVRAVGKEEGPASNGGSNGGSSSPNGSGTGSGSGGNGGSLPPNEPPSTEVNGGGGSNGSSGGGSGSNGNSSSSNNGGGSGDSQHPQGFSLPFSAQQLKAAALIAAVGLLSQLVASASHRGKLQRDMEVVMASLSEMADGPSTRDSVAAIKRLLRELFAEQLSIKQRLAAAEESTAAGSQLEAADDYHLRLALGSGSSWARAPVRLSGNIVAAGVLPWTQEGSGAGTLDMLSGLGVSAAADARLQLHSVLAGGKRRVTAEFCQAHAQDGGAAAALKLQTLLFRVQAKSWLKLLIAPLGGSLEALGRSIAPVRGDYGCTQALRHGHGLRVLQQQGSGKAISVSSSSLSATAGFFMSGASKTGIAQVQARSQDGHSLSLVAAHCRPCTTASTGAGDATTTASSSSHDEQPAAQTLRGVRFLGAQSPAGSRLVGSSSSSGIRQPALSGQVLGAAGVLPLTDTCTATAWAEKPLSAAGGAAGWGMGLFCQPDSDGLELGLAAGRPTSCSSGGGGGGQQRAARSQPLYCELSAKVPAGDGLSISPCAVLTYRDGAASLAYVMQSCWRW